MPVLCNRSSGDSTTTIGYKQSSIGPSNASTQPCCRSTSWRRPAGKICSSTCVSTVLMRRSLFPMLAAHEHIAPQPTQRMRLPIKAALPHCLPQGLDGLRELVDHARRFANGERLLACHVLQQGSLQACFGWHQDNKNNPFTKFSMVFLLSRASSTMRIAGYGPFEYAAQGSGCVFPSGAHHRSGESRSGTLKITFFFGSTSSTSGASVLFARKARNEVGF